MELALEPVPANEVEPEPEEVEDEDADEASPLEELSVEIVDPALDPAEDPELFLP